MSLSAPEDIQLCRERKKKRHKTQLKAPSALVCLCTGFFCDFSGFFPTFHVEHYSFHTVQIKHLFFTNQRDERCAAFRRINMKERGGDPRYFGRTVVKMTSIVFAMYAVLYIRIFLNFF